MVEQGYWLLITGLCSGDSNCGSGCNGGVPPFKDSCRKWSLTDEALVNQFVGLLSNAQVPAADASNDQVLLRGLPMVVAADAAPANAISSDNGTAASSAIDNTTSGVCTAVAPVLSRLDQSLPCHVTARDSAHRAELRTSMGKPSQPSHVIAVAAR